MLQVFKIVLIIHNASSKFIKILPELGNQFKTFVLFRDDQNDELIAVITTFPISQPYIPVHKSQESENS